MNAKDVENLYNQHFEGIYRYFYSWLLHKQESEELVSDCFLRALNFCESFAPESVVSKKAWLFKIARNLLVDYFRKKKPIVVDFSEFELPEKSKIEENTDIEINFKKVLVEISGLESRQGEIIMMRFQNGLKNKEIAEILKIEEKSVSSSIAKALKTLRSKLKGKI